MPSVYVVHRLPGQWQRNYIFNLLTDIKNIMLLRYLWEVGAVQFFFKNAISSIFIFEID